MGGLGGLSIKECVGFDEVEIEGVRECLSNLSIVSFPCRSEERGKAWTKSAEDTDLRRRRSARLCSLKGRSAMRNGSKTIVHYLKRADTVAACCFGKGVFC